MVEVDFPIGGFAFRKFLNVALKVKLLQGHVREEGREQGRRNEEIEDPKRPLP